MRDFQRQKGWRNILESWPVLTGLLLLLLFFAWGVFGFTGKMRATRVNRKIAEGKISQLQQEKEKLSYDIAKLKTEEGVEESIRMKFGLAKEDEGVIVVVEDKDTQEDQSSASSGFFSFFTKWFK